MGSVTEFLFVTKFLKDFISSLELGKMFVMGFRTVIYWIDQIVYEFIINIYNLFRILCDARIVNNELIGELSKRIGLILGLVMFFYVTFDFIQILIDPDKIQDKEKGPLNIIKKFIIVIILLGTSSFIFNYLHTFQSAVISPGTDGVSVIERLILPYKVNTNNFGAAISGNFMKEFYKLTADEEAPDAEPVESDEGFTYDVCKDNAENLPNNIASFGSLEDGFFCLNARYQTDDGSRFYIDFNPLSVLVGIFVLWTLLMYCISVGMRVIQLALLEIISPAAFVSYLSPKKDTMFSKFWKIYFSTYIDVFIRIAIIDFVVLVSGLILDLNDHGFWGSIANPEGSTKFWLSVFMILALLSFAKKAPDLIKQFLPDKVASGLSFGISTKDRAGLGMIGGTLAGAATGLVGGAVGGAMSGKGIFGSIKGAAGGAITGTAGGIGRGFFAGAKGKDLRDSITNANKNQATANLNKAQLRASGVTRAEQMGDAFRSRFGMMSGYEAEDKALTMSSNVKTLLEGEDPIKHLREAREAYRSSGGTDNFVYKEFDSVEKEILAQEYSWSYAKDSGDAKIVVRAIKDSNGNEITSAYQENYSSNRAIFNAIHDNEKRAGHSLDSYNGVVYQFDATGAVSNYGAPVSPAKQKTSYKADNNALKTAKADRRNKSK